MLLIDSEDAIQRGYDLVLVGFVVGAPIGNEFVTDLAAPHLPLALEAPAEGRVSVHGENVAPASDSEGDEA